MLATKQEERNENETKIDFFFFTKASSFGAQYGVVHCRGSQWKEHYKKVRNR